MREKYRVSIAAVVIVALFSSSAAALSPPWYELQRKLAASYGDNECVVVNEPVQQKRRQYLIRIDVCEEAMARALATVIRPAWKMGNITVKVNVFTPGGTQAQMLEAVE